MEKVRVTKEVAEAIEIVTISNTPAEIIKISALNGWGGDEDDYAECLNSSQLSLDTLIIALYIGYEIKKTPEEELAESYRFNYLIEGQDDENRAFANGIRYAVNTLGIKIEGVNV